MKIVDRSPSLGSEFSLKAGCDSKFLSSLRLTLDSTAAGRLLRVVIGCASFSALVACGQSSSSQTTMTDPAAGSAPKPAVTLEATKSSVATGTPVTLKWSAKDA